MLRLVAHSAAIWQSAHSHVYAALDSMHAWAWKQPGAPQPCAPECCTALTWVEGDASYCMAWEVTRMGWDARWSASIQQRRMG
jgi:hypothetical protein